MSFFDICMTEGKYLKNIPGLVTFCQDTQTSCLPMYMQLHWIIPWRKWLEHPVKNPDMNDFHYIFLSSKVSLCHIPFHLFLQQEGCNNVWHNNQVHLHLDNENGCGHSLKCGGIILIHTLDIHISSWHDLQ